MPQRRRSARAGADDRDARRHAVDYDEAGAVIGMVLTNVRSYLQRDGELTISIPPDRVAAAQIESALIAA